MFSSVQSFSHVWFFVTPWTAACQASLSITNSWSLLKLMSIELMMPPSHLILLSPPSPPTFNLSQHQALFKWVSSLHQSIRVSASASVLPMNIQDWFPLGWTGWILMYVNVNLNKKSRHVWTNTSFVISMPTTITITITTVYWALMLHTLEVLTY